MRLGVLREGYSWDDLDGGNGPEDKNLAPSTFVDGDWLSDVQYNLCYVTSQVYCSESLITF